MFKFYILGFNLFFSDVPQIYVCYIVGEIKI